MLFLRTSLLLFLLFALSLTPSLAIESAIEDPLAQEEDCLEEIGQEDFEIKPEYLQMTIRRAWWHCAEQLIKTGASSGLDLNDDFDAEYRFVKDSIDNLKNVLLRSQPLQLLQPAFQWAQSGSHVYLNIKFSHKLDAPATLDVNVDNCTIGAHTFDLIATKPPKQFRLHLDLFGEIDPSQSHWSVGSVGKFSASLKKRDNKVWGGLLKGKEVLKQMHLWFDKQEQFEAELSRMEEMEEEELERREREEEKEEASTRNGKKTQAGGAAHAANTAKTSKKKVSFAKKKKLEEKEEEVKQKKAFSELEADVLDEIQKLSDDKDRRVEQYEKEAKAEKAHVDHEALQMKKEIERKLKGKKKLAEEDLEGKKRELLRKIEKQEL